MIVASNAFSRSKGEGGEGERALGKKASAAEVGKEDGDAGDMVEPARGPGITGGTGLEMECLRGVVGREECGRGVDGAVASFGDEGEGILGRE